MRLTVKRLSGGTCGTSSVVIVRNTIFSCKTLLCVRLSTSAGGVPSALPYMNTAVPGTRVGGSAARSASNSLSGTRSEERRVGKECRWGGGGEDEKRKVVREAGCVTAHGW